MIKAIYLDLGKVLIDFDLARAVEGLNRLTSWSREEIQAFLGGNLIRDYELGKISSTQFHDEFCLRLGVEIPFQDFSRMWSGIFLSRPLLSETFLKGLASRYPLHLLSNTNELHYEFVVQQYPILGILQERILSFQVGRMKPQQEIYQVAVARSGVRAEEIFFTDDRLENIEAARAAGIQAVQFQSEDQLKSDLSRTGVLF